MGQERYGSVATGVSEYTRSLSSTSTMISKTVKAPWQDYPFSLATYNPFTEWGEHYQKLLERDLWSSKSSFVLQDMTGSSVSERRIKGTDSVDEILEEDPDLRIFYCDSKLCDDLVTRASLSADDIKKIFFRYNFSTIFLDRFIGRNRCTTGSRKTHDPDDPSRITSYDLWYDLPCRIYGAEHEYNWHFILFTVYVHFDVVRNKTVVFYIHRLGSEHHSTAEASSQLVKKRVRTTLEHASQSRDCLVALQSCPFIVQLPTMVCCIIFWTETLHKERLNMWDSEDRGKKNLADIDTSAMHDISRYVHSYLANIEIVQTTLSFVKAEHEWFARNIECAKDYTATPWFGVTSDTISAQLFQVQVILIWTKEVLKRTGILIDLYFNKMSQINSIATGKIAEETQKDAISMRTIAIVTMLFLPATFISSFFNMTFFQTGIFKELPFVWIYFITVIPLTIIVLWVWNIWLQDKMRRIKGSGSEARDFLKIP